MGKSMKTVHMLCGAGIYCDSNLLDANCALDWRKV